MSISPSWNEGVVYTEQSGLRSREIVARRGALQSSAVEQHEI